MNLSGVTILDLSTLGPGSYATQLLADLSADIVTVERLDSRERDLAPNDFAVLNRGKQSLAIDLKRDEGRATFLELADDADVLVEQFRPGVMEDLGLGFETVRSRTRPIVYCSITGFGQESPERDRVGHSINYAAHSGFLDMTRPDESARPVLPGHPVADMAAGAFAALSIVTALYSVASGDEDSQYVDLGITDAMLSFSQTVAADVAAGETPRPGDTLLTGKYPCYGVYETNDGQYIALGAIDRKFWTGFCRAAGVETLVDYHFAEDERVRREVRSEVSEVFRTRTRDEWTGFAHEHDLPISPVLRPDEVVESDHVRERRLRLGGGDRLSRIGFPVRTLPATDRPDGDVPSLGEHTRSILTGAGISPDRVTALRDDGVVSTGDRDADNG
jgi:crotonobetainyl-CoA:carnitine CoA-transferase CaiB-like acyl-CoA transferase